MLCYVQYFALVWKKNTSELFESTVIEVELVLLMDYAPLMDISYLGSKMVDQFCFQGYERDSNKRSDTWLFLSAKQMNSYLNKDDLSDKDIKGAYR